MQVSREVVRQEAHNTFVAQHADVLRNLAAYKEFEQVEGQPWPRFQRIVGGIGNAGELSAGIAAGDVERISEGHGDMWWTVHAVAGEYKLDVDALADRFVDARRVRHTAGLADTTDKPMLRIFEGLAEASRYAAVLDGVRTFPNPEQGLQASIGKVVTHLTLLAPAINRALALSIDFDKNVTDLIRGLDIRVPLQTLYGRLRNGAISRAEAEAGALALARHARRDLGLDEPVLETIWAKAPTRVKGEHVLLPHTQWHGLS